MKSFLDLREVDDYKCVHIFTQMFNMSIVPVISSIAIFTHNLLLQSLCVQLNVHFDTQTKPF